MNERTFFYIFAIYFYLCYLSIKNYCDTRICYSLKLALSTYKHRNITFSASSIIQKKHLLMFIIFNNYNNTIVFMFKAVLRIDFSYN